MRTKAGIVCAVISVLMLAALFALWHISDARQYDSLILISPKESDFSGVSVGKAEEICEDEFLLTYEINSRGKAQAVNSSHTVNLIGTNSAYRDVTGYNMPSGGFFTKSAWENNNRYAVLNETAASQIFGSFDIAGNTVKINGDVWIVTGVISDGDSEELNIYLPSGIEGGRAQTLLALMSEPSGIDRFYVSNTLQGVGVQESSCDITSLSAIALGFRERFIASIYLAICAIALGVMLRGIGMIVKQAAVYRLRLKEVYLRELIIKYPRDILKTTVLIIVTTLSAALLPLLSPRVLEIFLTLKDSGFLLDNVGDAFAGKTEWPAIHHPVGVTCFILFVFFIVLALLFFLRKKKSKQNKNE